MSLNDIKPHEWDHAYQNWRKSREGLGTPFDFMQWQKEKQAQAEKGMPLCFDNTLYDEWKEASMADEKAKGRALDKQVGGSHYKDLAIQPIEMTYNRYGYQGVKAALHTKVDKYLLRDKDDELGQLEKAKHCLELLIDFYKQETGKYGQQ